MLWNIYKVWSQSVKWRYVHCSATYIIKWWCLKMSVAIWKWSIKANQKTFWTVIFYKTLNYASAISFIFTHLWFLLPSGTALPHFKRGASTNRKLSGISVLNAKETILKKMNVSIIVYFCLDTASVLILFKHTSYL